MKLNHLNLTVDDVPGARRFLEKHFELRPYGEGQKNFDVLLPGPRRLHDRSTVLTPRWGS
jgi:hypothetical protein